MRAILEAKYNAGGKIPADFKPALKDSSEPLHNLLDVSLHHDYSGVAVSVVLIVNLGYTTTCVDVFLYIKLSVAAAVY